MQRRELRFSTQTEVALLGLSISAPIDGCGPSAHRSAHRNFVAGEHAATGLASAITIPSLLSVVRDEIGVPVVIPAD
jgi:hypothetical protein